MDVFSSFILDFWRHLTIIIPGEEGFLMKENFHTFYYEKSSRGLSEWHVFIEDIPICLIFSSIQTPS